MVLVLAGLNAAVRPAGSPVADRATALLKPFRLLTETVLVPEELRGIVRLATEAERLKFGATTVRLMVVVLLSFPEIPVTVTG